MKSKLAVLMASGLLAGVLASSPGEAASITYKLNTYTGSQFSNPWNDPVTVSWGGRVKTDGKTGALALSDISSFTFNFTIADKTGTASYSFSNKSNPTWYFFQGALTADSKGLYFNFNVPNGFPDRNLIDVGGNGPDFSEVMLEGPSGFGSAGIYLETLNKGETLFLGVYIPKSGNVKIATAISPAPAAFLLSATGLGAMGLFGWRRKQKTTTIA